MNRLEEIAGQIAQQASPPVDKWKPATNGEIDIRIDEQGFWFHEGDSISREPLVKLFASILWHESEQYFLVTPVEKLRIDVADVPYMIHQAEYVDGAWVAVTNTHEQIIISDQHPVQLRQYGELWVPYVRVRFDLWARVNRSIYYQWVTEAMEGQDQSSDPAADGPLQLQSGEYLFEVAR